MDTKTQSRDNRTNPAHTEELLTVAELAALLRVRRSWVYGHLSAGTMPIEYMRVGKYPRFKLSAVMRYLESETRPARIGA